MANLPAWARNISFRNVSSFDNSLIFSSSFSFSFLSFCTLLLVSLAFSRAFCLDRLTASLFLARLFKYSSSTSSSFWATCSTFAGLLIGAILTEMYLSISVEYQLLKYLVLFLQFKYIVITYVLQTSMLSNNCFDGLFGSQLILQKDYIILFTNKSSSQCFSVLWQIAASEVEWWCNPRYYWTIILQAYQGI